MSLIVVNSETRIPVLSATLKNAGMPKAEDTYRDRLRLLVVTHGSGKQTTLAGRIGKSPAQVAQWINRSIDSKSQKPRVMSRGIARQIEAVLQLDDGWMDRPLTASERATLGEPPEQSADVLPLDSPKWGAQPLVLRLAQLMAPLDATDRKQAAAIFHDLALAPERAGEMAAKLGRLLGESANHQGNQHPMQNAGRR